MESNLSVYFSLKKTSTITTTITIGVSCISSFETSKRLFFFTSLQTEISTCDRNKQYLLCHQLFCSTHLKSMQCVHPTQEHTCVHTCTHTHTDTTHTHMHTHAHTHSYRHTRTHTHAHTRTHTHTHTTQTHTHAHTHAHTRTHTHTHTHTHSRPSFSAHFLEYTTEQVL